MPRTLGIWPSIFCEKDENEWWGWDWCVAAAFHWTHRIDATAGRRKRGEAFRSDRLLRGQTKHNQVAYPFMDAVFFETTTFSRLRPGYLDDDGYRAALQISYLGKPRVRGSHARNGRIQKAALAR